MIRYSEKSILRKKGFLMAHSSRVWFTTMGHSWQKELVAGHIAFIVRKQTEVNVRTQFAFCFVFSWVSHSVPEMDFGCLSLLFYNFLCEIASLKWNWNSPNWLDWLASEPIGPSCLLYPTSLLGLQVYVPVSGFDEGSRYWAQVPMFANHWCIISDCCLPFRTPPMNLLWGHLHCPIYCLSCHCLSSLHPLPKDLFLAYRPASLLIAPVAKTAKPSFHYCWVLRSLLFHHLTTTTTKSSKAYISKRNI